MKILLLLLLYSFNSFSSINKNIEEKPFKLSKEVEDAMEKLRQTYKRLAEQTINRIKVLKNIKERSLAEEQELNALELVYEGDPVKINNYLNRHKKMKDENYEIKYRLMD
jgi:hypothetical protein